MVRPRLREGYNKPAAIAACTVFFAISGFAIRNAIEVDSSINSGIRATEKGEPYKTVARDFAGANHFEGEFKVDLEALAAELILGGVFYVDISGRR